MKTKTEKILMVLKVLALLGGIGYSIAFGTQLLSLIASFINPDWAKHVYGANQELFRVREYSTRYYGYAMSLIIAVSAIKAITWYLVFDLLLKLKLIAPFSIQVAKKLERISYLLFEIWIIGFVGHSYIQWLAKTTGTNLAGLSIGEEYLFIAGIVYVVSQLFRRGIEIQEENLLTV